MAKNKHFRGKALYVTTYIIALLALIAGLLLQINVSTFSKGVDFSASPILQLGGALAALGVPVSFGKGLSDRYSFTLTLFGRSFDLGAALLILYALTAAAAVILLIPALAMKRKRSRKIIFFAELLALTPLFALTLAELYRGGDLNLSVIAAFGVGLLCLTIQCLAFRRGSGVIKLTVLLLSSAAVLSTVVNLAAIFPAYGRFMQYAANALKGRRPFDSVAGLFSADGNTVYASSLLGSLSAGNFALFTSGTLAAAGWFALTAVGLAVVNTYFDILGLGKKTNGFMLACNVIRYFAELLVVSATAVAIAFAGGSFGVALYLLFSISALQLIIQAIRLSRFSKKKKAKKVAKRNSDTREEYAQQYGAYSSPAAAGRPADNYAADNYSDNYEATAAPYSPVMPEENRPAKSSEPVINGQLAITEPAAEENVAETTEKIAYTAQESAAGQSAEITNEVTREPIYKNADTFADEPAPIPDGFTAVTAENADAETVQTIAVGTVSPVFSEDPEIISQTATIFPPKNEQDEQNYGLYEGPTDDFIDKLTEEQKAEFARLFLGERRENFANIPEYVVGGDNSRFFSLLFIYFSRVRKVVTEGLMNKFYEQANLM